MRSLQKPFRRVLRCLAVHPSTPERGTPPEGGAGERGGPTVPGPGTEDLARDAAGARTEPRDLGFGTVVAERSRLRLLNRDGTFNVVRRGLGWRAALSLYHTLLALSWPAFLALVAALYLVVNALFALAYLACGPGAVHGLEERAGGPFAAAFFFSVHTFSTIGYGDMVPASLPAELLVTLEAIAGLLCVALATGLVFARFSRPMADIAYSRQALIAPYGDGRAFMFRIANRRRGQIIDLRARVIFSRFERAGDGRLTRRFYDLPLERHEVSFFPLTWTIVHPIDAASPLAHFTRDECRSGFVEAEFLVLLTGIDEAFHQTVHSRTSYRGDEVVWGARFSTVFVPPDDADAPLAVDIAGLDEYEPVALPAEPAADTGGEVRL